MLQSIAVKSGLAIKILLSASNIAIETFLFHQMTPVDPLPHPVCLLSQLESTLWACYESGLDAAVSRSDKLTNAHHLQLQFDRFHTYTTVKGLTLNSHKTNEMAFFCSNPPVFCFNGTPFESVQELKYVGQPSAKMGG